MPLLGINLGNLGYLAEVDRDHVDDAIRLLVEGRVSFEERMMLRGRVARGDEILYEDVALNDIAIGGRGLTVLYFKV